jgi:hypothetical protein
MAGNCEKCGFRSRYARNPRSVLGAALEMACELVPGLKRLYAIIARR